MKVGTLDAGRIRARYKITVRRAIISGRLAGVTYVSLVEVASFIAAVTGWEGFAASVATKLLHKKRPKLIPILDNEAIFGAYMNLKWPEKLASTDCVYAKARIARRLRSAHPRVPQATYL